MEVVITRMEEEPITLSGVWMPDAHNHGCENRAAVILPVTKAEAALDLFKHRRNGSGQVVEFRQHLV